MRMNNKFSIYLNLEEKTVLSRENIYYHTLDGMFFILMKKESHINSALLIREDSILKQVTGINRIYSK